jgi:Papain-like cysteine protease AvrRpt2
MRLKGPFRKLFGMSKRDHGEHVGDDGLEYEVPFVHQNHVNLCGDASAQMLVLFYGRPATIGMKSNVGHANSYRLKRNPRGVVEGSNDDDVVATIQAAGLQAWNICPRVGQWTAAFVRSALETYGPYAQTVRFSVAGHWVVVTGTDGHSVIYHDPWRGKNMSKTIGDWAIAAGDGPSSAVAATEEVYVEAPNGIQANGRH